MKSILDSRVWSFSARAKSSCPQRTTTRNTSRNSHAQTLYRLTSQGLETAPFMSTTVRVQTCCAIEAGEKTACTRSMASAGATHDGQISPHHFRKSRHASALRLQSSPLEKAKTMAGKQAIALLAVSCSSPVVGVPYPNTSLRHTFYSTSSHARSEAGTGHLCFAFHRSVTYPRKTVTQVELSYFGTVQRAVQQHPSATTEHEHRTG